jgi:hypothetical protein
MLLEGSVEVGDVGLVMLVMVKPHCSFIDVGFESGIVVG